MARVHIDKVSKIYSGSQKAVDDVDIDIVDGEFIVLVGPSGCGKSTLLRMVAGLEKISEGEIRIDERVVNDVDPAERDIAMVFQNYALYPHMTVRNNLAYGLKNRGMAGQEIEARVAEAARALELQPYLDRKPRALSGGQRQRVAMGRAIVREPAVFLFDEPLSNLDAKLRVQMRGEIKQLQKRLGTTSIYVTHDQLEAMTLADRLVVLNGGRIEQIGSPLDVYRRPESMFVAAFIGSPAMNLFSVRHDKRTALLGETPIRLNTDLNGAKEISLGLRPEDLFPVVAGTDGAMPLRVSYVEELGAQRLVHGHVADQGITATLASDHELADVLHVAARPASLHVFDPATGRRIN